MNRGPRGQLRRAACLAAAVLLSAGCRPEGDNGPAAGAAASAPAPREAVRTVERGPVRLTVRLDRDTVRAPEPVMLTMTVETESGVEIELPAIEGRLGDFLVESIERNEPTDDGVTRRDQWTLRLEGVLPGRFELPEIVVEYRDRRPAMDGTPVDEKGSVACAGLSIEVEASLADVKGPAELASPWPRGTLYGIVGTIAAMAAAGLLARRLRARRGAPITPAAPPEPPHLWALRALAALLAEKLVEAGRVQEFYYRINWLVRRYVELRFSLMAGEQTSDEFLRALSGSGALADDHKRLLRDFTAACDPVKYARHRPAPDDIAWVTDAARRFVVETQESAGASPPAEDRAAEAVA